MLGHIAARDRNVKVIINTRNFGHIRSRTTGCCSAAETPSSAWPRTSRIRRSSFPRFSTKWREGYKVVLGVKTASEESAVMFAIRRIGYG